MKQLFELPILNEILHKEERIDIIHALNLQRNENSYSDIISYLFSSQYGSIIILKLIEFIKDHHGYSHNITDIDKIFVKREYFRIDILIIFNEKYIICFENKIDASERSNQISDYQNMINKYYSDYELIFIFLTPDGRMSYSHDMKYQFIFALSYSDLTSVLKKSLKEVNNNDFCSYINTFIICIEEEIIMDKLMVEEIKKIWGNYNYRRKINILLKNKPSLSTISDSLFDELDNWVQNNYNDKLESEIYPSKGDMREFKISSKYFDSSGIPLVFMFYDAIDKDCISMRLVFWKDSVNKKLENNLIVFNSKGLEPMENTYWCSLYSGRKYKPDYEFTETHDYGESLVKLLCEPFKKEYITMHDYIRTKFDTAPNNTV